MRHLLSPAVWGLLAGLTGLAGYIPYLRDAWRRASDPDPAAWLIWTVEYSVLLAVQAAQHPPWAALCLAALQLAGTATVLGVLAVRGGWHFGPGTVGPARRDDDRHGGLALRARAGPGDVPGPGRGGHRHDPRHDQRLPASAQRDPLDLAGVHPGRPAGSAGPGRPRTAAALRLPGILRGHGLRGADRRRPRRPGPPGTAAAAAPSPAGPGARRAHAPAGLPRWPVGVPPRSAAGAARPWLAAGGAAAQPAAGTAVPRPAAARRWPGTCGDAGQPAAGAALPRPATGAAAPNAPGRPARRQPG